MNIAKNLLLGVALTLVSCVHVAQPSKPVPPSAGRINPSASTVTANGERPDTQCSYFYFLWGKTAEIEGHYDEALDAYDKAIVCDGNADYVIRNLTVLLLRMNRKQQAMEWVEKLLEAKPEDLKVKLFQADLYGAMGEDAKAISIYQALLTKQPKDPEILLKLAKQYLNTLDYLKARDTLERLVAIEPDSFMGHYFLARLYRELKFDQKASVAYQKALDLNWSSPLALEVAGFYESQKMIDQAIELYTKLLSDDSASEEAANRLVRIYLTRNQSDKALAVLHDLRESATDSQKIDFTIGRIYMEQHKYQEAIATFKGMLTRDPKLDLARSLLALAYYESGDHGQAKALLLSVKRGDPGFDDALSLLIKMYAEEKNYQSAIDLLRRVIKESKEETQKYDFALASLYEEQGKLSEAEKVLVNTILRSPKSEVVYFTYGMFLQRHGRLDEAMAQMEKVLAINHDDPMALNYIGYSWADRGINLPQALAYIQKALSQRKDDGFIQDSLGWVYFKMEKLELAVEALEKAVATEPDDPTIHEHLGDVYLASHKPQLALDNYKKSLALSSKAEDKARISAKIGAIRP
jgi:tetratricopeptide (TPR) repeat protein